MIATTREEYAVKALIYIASKEIRKASISEIAEKNSISFAYILRICSLLRQHGILTSEKGRSGGYILEKDPSTISLFDIIEAVGRKSVEIKCNYGAKHDTPCYQSECISMSAWNTIREKTDELYKEIKLSDLIGGKNAT